jgi:hypothetical protein
MKQMPRWVGSFKGLALLGLIACDPVHSNDIAALGGEAPGVSKGPMHRPGQPCTVCHDGAIGDPPAFSVAGTVFETPSSAQGADGVTVTMVDSSGSSHSATTNAAGNFYLTPQNWTPVYPILSVTVAAGDVGAIMHSQISWSGSCGWCHVKPAGPSSPGHVSLMLDDGGTPP